MLQRPKLGTAALAVHSMNEFTVEHARIMECHIKYSRPKQRAIQQCLHRQNKINEKHIIACMARPDSLTTNSSTKVIPSRNAAATATLSHDFSANVCDDVS